MSYTPFPDFSAFAAVPFNPQQVERAAATLQLERTDASAFDSAVRALTRRSALDSGEIEGLYSIEHGSTRSIAIEAAVWERLLGDQPHSVARSIGDSLAGYDFVLDAANHARPISETWIRELQAVLCNSQGHYRVRTPIGWQTQDLPLGVYKIHPNEPSGTGDESSPYCPVDMTPAEMSRFVEELRLESFATAHPVMQATYSHYCIAHIHPFADGNGRVARALASVYLYRNPGVPFLLLTDQRNLYLNSLEAADQSAYNLLVEFFEQRALDAVNLVLDQLRVGKYPDPETASQRIVRALNARHADGSEDDDRHASRLDGELETIWREVSRDSHLPPGITCTVHRSNSHVFPPQPESHRPRVSRSKYLQVSLHVEGFSGQGTFVGFSTWPHIQVGGALAITCDPLDYDYSDDFDDGESGLNLNWPAALRLFSCPTSDVSPTISNLLKLRLYAWAEAQLRLMLGIVAHKVEQASINRGLILGDADSERQ